MNRTDLYARQQQVVIGEAALLWLELVRPNAAASSTYAPSLGDALSILERISAIGLAAILQSARRRKRKRMEQLLSVDVYWAVA